MWVCASHSQPFCTISPKHHHSICSCQSAEYLPTQEVIQVVSVCFNTWAVATATCQGLASRPWGWCHSQALSPIPDVCCPTAGLLWLGVHLAGIYSSSRRQCIFDQVRLEQAGPCSDGTLLRGPPRLGSHHCLESQCQGHWANHLRGCAKGMTWLNCNAVHFSMHAGQCMQATT